MGTNPRPGAAVYTAAEVAEKWGVCTDTLYDSVKNGTCPVEPIRVSSRRMVWPKARVDEQLGVSSETTSDHE
jgi:predicted DNA-binding transcriptional regulator AlpA